MNIILSTRNVSKAAQINAVFADTPLRVVSLTDAGIDGKAIEDGETLEDNGLKKARFAWEHSHGWCMSDDSGIFIDALGGFPGVHAADWMGTDASTEAIMLGILEKMRGIEDRRATFRTVATLISPDGEVKTFTGEVKGQLLPEPRTAFQPNMPYSSLFFPNGQDKVWAEMTPEEENKVSHRGKAFAQVRDYLLSVLNS
jgi:XTP/dITP diphosphohydrolase